VNLTSRWLELSASQSHDLKKRSWHGQRNKKLRLAHSNRLFFASSRFQLVVLVLLVRCWR
jgi:hypothetical protein